MAVLVIVLAIAVLLLLGWWIYRSSPRRTGAAASPSISSSAALPARDFAPPNELVPAEPSPEAPPSASAHGAEPRKLAPVPDGAYGPGSADPTPGGRAPYGYEIKGDVGSMQYHTRESPSYGRTKAEVWFVSEAVAEKAGFSSWDNKKR